MGITRYSADDVEVENGRPVPGDRIEEYTDHGLWACQWANYKQTHFTVERVGDNHPTEKYHFRTRAVGDGSPPREIVAAPVTRTTAKLRKHGSGYAVDNGRRGSSTRREEIGADEVPDIVRRYLEENGVEIVETLEGVDG